MNHLLLVPKAQPPFVKMADNKQENSMKKATSTDWGRLVDFSFVK